MVYLGHEFLFGTCLERVGKILVCFFVLLFMSFVKDFPLLHRKTEPDLAAAALCLCLPLLVAAPPATDFHQLQCFSSTLWRCQGMHLHLVTFTLEQILLVKVGLYKMEAAWSECINDLK